MLDIIWGCIAIGLLSWFYYDPQVTKFREQRIRDKENMKRMEKMLDKRDRYWEWW